MFHTQTEMEAIATTAPSMRAVMNPTTLELDPHLCYDAEIQYLSLIHI